MFQPTCGTLRSTSRSQVPLKQPKPATPGASVLPSNNHCSPTQMPRSGVSSAIDTRIDSYGDRYFLDWRELFIDEQAINRFVKRYDVKFMLLLRPDFDQVRGMRSLKEAGWRTLFADHKMVLLGR